jgi:hypothetical protein
MEDGIKVGITKEDRARIYKIEYVYDLCFENCHMAWSKFINNQSDEFFDIVLVYNEGEAAGYPNDMIVVWPSETTLRMLDAFNKEIVREGTVINIERYSLQYPLAIDNLIEDWVKIYAIWITMPKISNYRITQYAISGWE